MSHRGQKQVVWVRWLLVGLLGVGVGASAADVTFVGSTTVLPIAQVVAEELASRFDIEMAGGGSSVGVASLIDGTTDIGDHSRAIKISEYQKALDAGVFPFTFHVANDAIAVIVNKANPVADLTLAQLKAIYQGQYANWSQLGWAAGGSISVVGRDSASGTFETWEMLVMSGQAPAPAVLALASNADVASEVASNPNAIGYVGIAYVNEALHNKVDVEGKEATLASAINYSYPIARPLFMSTNGFPGSGPVLDVILFILSDAGQQLVQGVGYAPIRELE